MSVVTLAGQPSRAQCIALEGEDIADSTVHEQVHKRCGVDRRFIGPGSNELGRDGTHLAPGYTSPGHVPRVLGDFNASGFGFFPLR